MSSSNATGLPNDTDEFLTTEECAKFLRVSAVTLERWRCEGGPDHPPYIKFPGKRGRVVYSQRALLTWLTGRERSSTSQPN